MCFYPGLAAHTELHVKSPPRDLMTSSGLHKYCSHEHIHIQLKLKINALKRIIINTKVRILETFYCPPLHRQKMMAVIGHQYSEKNNFSSRREGYTECLKGCRVLISNRTNPPTLLRHSILCYNLLPKHAGKMDRHSHTCQVRARMSRLRKQEASRPIIHRSPYNAHCILGMRYLLLDCSGYGKGRGSSFINAI